MTTLDFQKRLFAVVKLDMLSFCYYFVGTRREVGLVQRRHYYRKIIFGRSPMNNHFPALTRSAPMQNKCFVSFFNETNNLRQVATWTNVNEVLWRHMSSTGHKDFLCYVIFSHVYMYICLCTWSHGYIWWQIWWIELWLCIPTKDVKLTL